MLTADREEFEENLAVLCAGFNLPVTPHRKQAYFVGLAKMSLIQFIRCVEFALSDEGPDDLPTAKFLWKIHRALRGRPRIYDQHLPAEDTRDHLLFYANRMLLRHMGDRGGLGSTGTFVPGYGMTNCVASPELTATRRVVHATVDWFKGPVSEGATDATPADFIREFMRALNAVSPVLETTRRVWVAMAKDPSAELPFPSFMARELPDNYALKPQLELT